MRQLTPQEEAQARRFMMVGCRWAHFGLSAFGGAMYVYCEGWAAALWAVWSMANWCRFNYIGNQLRIKA